MQVRRVLPLSGVVFPVILVVAAAVLESGSPSSDSSVAKIVEYYAQHKNQVFVAAFLIAASALFLVLFGAGVAAAVGNGATTQVWERVFVGGSILAGGTMLLLAALQFATVDAVDNDAGAGAVQALSIANTDLWVAFNGAFGVMMLGAAGMLMPRAGFQRWLGWVALPLGIVLFIPFADFIGLILTLAWMVVAGIAVVRADSPRQGKPTASMA